MEYGDFFYIGADGLQFIKTKETVNFLDYLTWLSQYDFQPLEEHLVSVFYNKNGQKEQKEQEKQRQLQQQHQREWQQHQKHQQHKEHQQQQKNAHLPTRSIADDIIEGMITTSEADFNKKTKTDNYYICNAHAVLAVIRHIFKPEFINVLNFYNEKPETRFLVNSYQEILLWLLRDVEDLTSLYSENRQHIAQHTTQHTAGNTTASTSSTTSTAEITAKNTQSRSLVRGFIRNRYIHTASLYQVFRQGLYGHFSEHSFSDKEPSANIATIRQLIELRLRRAFGAMVFQDTYKHNAVEPLNMSLLFNVLKQYSDEIKIDGIRLENLNRIYTWSNIFIHSGLGDYSWIPFYLEIVLRGAFFGHKNKTGWSINNGISTTVSVIRSVWTDLIKIVNDGRNDENVRYKLVICKPECDSIPDGTGIARETSTSHIDHEDHTDHIDHTDITANSTSLTGNKTESNNKSNNSNSHNSTNNPNNPNNTNKANKVKGDGNMASTSNVVKFTVAQPPEALSLKAKLAWLSLSRAGNQFVHTNDGHWLLFNGDLNKSVIFCNDEKLIEWLEEITNRNIAENKIGFLQQFCPSVPELINEAVAAEMEKEVNGISGINGTNGTNGIK